MYLLKLKISSMKIISGIEKIDGVHSSEKNF